MAHGLRSAPAASAEEIAALLRVDFASFAQACFAELYPQTAFAPGWHVELVAARLAAVRRLAYEAADTGLLSRNLRRAYGGSREPSGLGYGSETG